MDHKTLEEAAKEERLKYYREWRRKNPDKVKQHNKNYWLKRAEKKLQEEAGSDDGCEATKNDDDQGNCQNRSSD